jgi:hypothetical protein
LEFVDGSIIDIKGSFDDISILIDDRGRVEDED